MKDKMFRFKTGKLPYPIFFPDATMGVVRTLSSEDVKSTKTPGVLVNTYHLQKNVGKETLQKFGGIGGFMNWDGALISDSGGFQVMSLEKNKKGTVETTKRGVIFKESRKRSMTFTPEMSIRYQIALGTDLLVCLDDFGTPGESYKKSKETVEKTLNWAMRCKKTFEREYERLGFNEEKRPYLIGVVQGGDYDDLRKMCIKELVDIGFDGLGYGGWTSSYKRMLEVGRLIALNCPKDYLLYGLGLGKPEDIVFFTKLGFKIFDCVLPTRDARHKRLYVYKASSISKIDLKRKDFYEFLNPGKTIFKNDETPVSKACDCVLCKNYSKAYLYHLFKVRDSLALRLSTIHNLRFYSILTNILRG